MSTYFSLICEDCKERVDGASRTVGGYCALAEGPACLIPFIISHAGCNVVIVSEHDERSYSESYFEWEESNVQDGIDRAYEAGRWGTHDTWTPREGNWKGRCEAAEDEVARLLAVAGVLQSAENHWKTQYNKIHRVLKDHRINNPDYKETS